MKALKAALRQVSRLFIDDGAFALAILIWLALIAGVTRFVLGAAAWSGPLLFVGLAAILAESVIRRSRK